MLPVICDIRYRNQSGIFILFLFFPKIIENESSLKHFEQFFFSFQAKAVGRVLFEQVCKQLHLLEADYFGLEYADVNGTRVRKSCNQITSIRLIANLIVYIGNPRKHILLFFYSTGWISRNQFLGNWGFL